MIPPGESIYNDSYLKNLNARFVRKCLTSLILCVFVKPEKDKSEKHAHLMSL